MRVPGDPEAVAMRDNKIGSDVWRPRLHSVGQDGDAFPRT